MVHNAFHIEPVLKKSSSTISGIEVWQQKVLVGTEEGELLVLQEAPSDGGQAAALGPTFNVIEHKRNFTKKPIIQMQVAESLGIMLTLTSDAIQINELPSLDMTAQLLKTRGAHAFSLNTQLFPPVLAAYIKKKIVLFRWEGNGGFTEVKELSVSEQVKCHAWCNDVICVGIGKKYRMINYENGTHKDLFDSNSASPSCFCLPGQKELLLGRDNISVFQDSLGRPSRKYGLCWSEAPVQILFIFPYLLAVLPKVVEVQLMETQTVVQSLSLRASAICATPDLRSAYVVANNCIYRLRPVPMARQVDALLEGQQLETCLRLCELASEDQSISNKAPAIYRAYGFSLFSTWEFDKAMGLFSRSKSLDPRNVIAMFPDLGDTIGDFKVADDVPEPSPELKAHKLLRAQVSLIKYLRGWRGLRSKDASPELGEAVDTALLKAMTRAEPENVLNFLQGSNMCNLDVGYKVLQEYEMWHELLALFNSHSLHRQALDLLAQYGQGPQEEHPLHGVTSTIEYLQGLGAESEQLIMEYSRWVLRASPDLGLTIFTQPVSTVKPMAIDAVLQHLKAFDEEAKLDKDKTMNGETGLRVQYLEHVIANGETRAAYHNELVLLLLDSVQRLKQILSAKQAGQLLPPTRYAAGTEPGGLGGMRRKLLAFLESSNYYSPDKMLAKLPMVDLYEERALILSKLGEHEQALNIYAHRLGDVEMAQEYCLRHYDPYDERTKEVYLDLLKVYLKPPDASAPMTMQALSLMSKYFERLDPALALDVLPPNTPLRSLQGFFENVVRQNSEVRKNMQISKNLLKSDNLAVAQEYHERRNRRVVITSAKKCKASNKRIGTSAFQVYPNNVVVLLGEKTDPHICPVTARSFKEQPAD